MNPQQTTDLYRSFPDLIRVPAGEGRILLYSQWSRSTWVVTATGLQLFQGCATFATLDEHAARLCLEMKLMPFQVEAVRGELANLAAAGLLVSRGQLLDVVRRSARSSDPPPRITTVGIPTRDRPATLEACLEGHVESARRHGRSTEFVVIDDSITTLGENRQRLDAIADRSGATIFHAGREEKSRFAEAIARQAKAPADLVRFALGLEDWPITTGGSRNALLLHTAGELMLQVDDDTRCQTLPAPECRAELALSTVFDPTEFWFFPEGKPPVVAGEAGETDLLGVHEQLLGRTIADCLADGKVADPALANTRFFRRLESGDGRILTTATGVYGDSGMGSSVALLTLDGPARARLHRSEADYRGALHRRQWMRSVTRPTITDGGYCMALNLGLDNRGLLPPFLPVQRNQDGVFAAVLALCRDGYMGYLPAMVVHLSPADAAASTSEDPWQRVSRLQTGHLLQVLLGSCPQGPGSSSPESRLERLGRWLEETASAKPADFAEYLRLHAWNALTRTLTQLEAMLRKYGHQPAYWAEDVRRALAALAGALPTQHVGLPAELCERWGEEQALSRFQGLVRRYGSLLRVWPEIVTAARGLRAAGNGLATRCGTRSERPGSG
jgi:hypothetical protein